MSGGRRVAVFVGSLRKESLNRKLAHALAALAAPSLELHIVEIGGLPMYNPDQEDSPPTAWIELRTAIRAAEAVLFVTPEYNRSIPAALKNAIDVGSRPTGKGAWSGKPGAVVSLTQGNLGGFGANHHLRQALVYVNVPAMAQPEVYIGGGARLFDGSGALVDDGTRGFLSTFLEAFSRWIEANLRD